MFTEGTGFLVQLRRACADASRVTTRFDPLGLDWELGDDEGTFVCAVTWHGEAGELRLETGGPGPAMLSLVGVKGVLWTRPLGV